MPPWEYKSWWCKLRFSAASKIGPNSAASDKFYGLWRTLKEGQNCIEANILKSTIFPTLLKGLWMESTPIFRTLQKRRACCFLRRKCNDGIHMVHGLHIWVTMDSSCKISLNGMEHQEWQETTENLRGIWTYFSHQRSHLSHSCYEIVWRDEDAKKLLTLS